MSHLFSTLRANGTGPGNTHVLSKPQSGRFDSPTQLSGLFLWMDASDLSTLSFQSDSRVGYWADKGPYKLDFIGPGSLAPTYLNAASSAGGRPCVKFNSQYMQNINGNYFNNIQTPYTIFFIGKIIAEGTFTTVISAASNDVYRRRLDFGVDGLYTRNSIFIGQGYNDTTTYRTLLPNDITGYSLFCAQLISTGSANFYADNTVVPVSGTALPYTFTGVTPSNVYLGSCAGFGYYNTEGTSNTEFTEIILYNRTLSTSEINKIQKYAANKYGNTAITGNNSLVPCQTINHIISNYQITYNYLLVGGGGGGAAGGNNTPYGGNGGSVVTGNFTSYTNRNLFLSMGAGGGGAQWYPGQYGYNYGASTNGSSTILNNKNFTIAITGSGGLAGDNLPSSVTAHNNGAGGNGNNATGNLTINGTNGVYSTITGGPAYWGGGGAGIGGIAGSGFYGQGGTGILPYNNSYNGQNGAAVISYLNSQSFGKRPLGGMVSSYTDSGGNLWWVHLFTGSTNIKL